MDLTRRSWAVAGLAVGLAVYAVVLDRPLGLAGAVLITAWLITRQYLFYRALRTLAEDLSVTQTVPKMSLRTNETVLTSLTATLESPSRLACSLDAGLPVATSATEPLSVTLAPTQQRASMTVDIRWPVTGRHTFDPATLTATDGLFREQLPVGTTPTVTVEPRVPRNLHVGEGGDRIATAFGEHDAGLLGSGLEPAGLREYVPGDAAARIDWNATARLGTAYVREFEAETDRETVLVVDHREALADGPTGETKLAYLREFALALVENARQLGDPLGLVAVGTDGITERIHPSTQPDRYRAIRRSVLDLEPTRAATADPTTEEPMTDSATGPTTEAPTPDPSTARATDRTPTGPEPDSPPSPRHRHRQHTRQADVRRAAATLDGEDTPFARTLRPFYTDRQVYLDRIDTDPLYRAVRTTLAGLQSRTFLILCTDDHAPTELLETVTDATGKGARLLVLLAPTVLYEEGGLSDIESAYDRYLEFEELRRELSRMDKVTALEVGPGDRLSAIITAGRDRSEPHRVGGEQP